MSEVQTCSRHDEWSDWLLHRRHADDPVYERLFRSTIERFRDRVLDGAELRSDMTLADIGTGDGLIAFGAIDRIGPSLRVILTDLSVPLLQHAETLATERAVHQQCTFLECSAEKLPQIPDASVDVVCTRAVLAYVADKRAALGEFHRILKPGGRMSIAEPIFMDDAYETIALRKMVDARGSNSSDRFLTLVHRWKAAQFPDTEELLKQNPIANYSERDLVRFISGSGFSEIRMELHVDILRSIITTWNVFLGSSPHPWAPTVGAILAKQFTPEERQFFEQTMRPIVENPNSTMTDRIVYVTAKKPI